MHLRQGAPNQKEFFLISTNIYAKSDHGIDIGSIDPNALYVLEKLQAQGHTAYLVGGSVRDLLLGLKPKDFDISTSAKPEEVKKIFRNCWLIGRRFRLAHIHFGKQIIEVATFRKGDTASKELITQDNEWGSPDEDVLRRDFTINGLFYDCENERVIDYVGGFEDLKKKTLSTIGNAEARFCQDPVRMLRLIKFQARLGFAIDDEALFALFKCRTEITKSSHARLLEEVLRMLESKHASTFFLLMSEYGLLKHLFPPIDTFLRSKDREILLSLLHEADELQKEKKLGRSTLMSILAWPLLNEKVKSIIRDSGSPPHLGAILQECSKVISDLCAEFMHLPKKLRLFMRFILTTQYRLTPLTNRKLMRAKTVEDEAFSRALDLTQIRGAFNPEAYSAYEEWKDRIPEAPERPKRRRRRSRRRS